MYNLVLREYKGGRIFATLPFETREGAIRESFAASRLGGLYPEIYEPGESWEEGEKLGWFKRLLHLFS